MQYVLELSAVHDGHVPDTQLTFVLSPINPRDEMVVSVHETESRFQEYRCRMRTATVLPDGVLLRGRLK